MRQLYYTHIYPHLTGNITIWGTDNPSKTYIQPLIKIQKKIIRIVNNKPPRTHTNPIMTKLKILNLTNLYILRVCVEMHPYIHPTKTKNQPEHNHHYEPITKIHDHNTRYAHNNHQFIPNTLNFSKTKTLRYNIDHLTQQYATIWNRLPAELRNTSSRSTFKTKTHNYLLQQQSQQ